MTEPKVTRRKITDLQPDAHNANRGTERGHRALDDSVNDVGLGRSILTDKNGIIVAGNKTHNAAVENGFEDIIEVETDGNTLVVVKRTDLDLNDPSPNNRARRAAYYDNRVGQISLDFDPAILLHDMQTGVDLSKLWTPDELAELLAGMQQDEPAADPGAQTDRADELQKIWQVSRGDVWQIGRHKLMCGDSTSAEDVARLMDGVKADAVVTDPPYAFGLGSNTNLRSKAGGWHDMMNNASWFTDLYKLYSSQVATKAIWVCCNWRTLPILMRASWDSSVSIESLMVWYKDWIGPGGMRGLRPTYELIALSLLNDYAIPDRGVEDFVNVPYSSHKEHGHPAEKPVDLIKHLITITSIDSIFDGFCGSGTALVAAEQCGIMGYGIEASAEYCAVILQRLKDMGLSPERVS